MYIYIYIYIIILYMCVGVCVCARISLNPGAWSGSAPRKAYRSAGHQQANGPKGRQHPVREAESRV